MNKVIEERHSKFNTEGNLLRKYIKQNLGLDVSEIQKIEKGYDNEVYICKTKNFDLVVRISRFGDISFQNESWAISKARESGVPTPKILLNSEVNLPDGEFSIMIQEKLPGGPLAEIRGKLSEGDFEVVLNNAGKILRKLHEIKVGGYYRVEDGSWDFESWREMMDSTVEDRSSEKQAFLKSGFSESQFEKIISYLIFYRDNFEKDSAVLCHGDFLPEHIFVGDNLEITGIIDFGGFRGDVPISEMSYFNFEAPGINIKPLIEGYGRDNFGDNFELEFQLSKLTWCGFLAHYQKMGDEEGVKLTVRELGKILRELEKFRLGI